MSHAPACARCQGTMIEGFVVDEGYGVNVVPQWIDGKPERSIWTGIRLRGKRRIPVTTWRCGRCGYLESYAPD